MACKDWQGPFGRVLILIFDFRPNNVYKPSGYQGKSSELGEDPLTTVRTLRNNLRKRALHYEKQDLPVKVSTFFFYIKGAFCI